MTRHLARLGLLAPALVAFAGAVALALWISGDWQLLASGPDYIPMAPITAAILILLGLSILARRLRPQSDGVRRVETVAVVIAIGVAVVELLAPSFGSRAPWGGLLPPPEAHAFPFPIGRMSPVTAAGFLFAGLALLLARRRQTSARWVAVWLAVAALVMALIVLAGYAAGAPLDYGAGRVPMALLTAATLFVLGLSQLLDDSTLALARAHLSINRDTPELGGERAFTLRLAGLTLGLTLLIVVTAIMYTRNELTQARASVWRELDSVASLKARELGQWREERLAEGRFLWTTPQINEDVRDFLARPNSQSARQRVVNWLDPIRGDDRYETAQVFDAQGRLRLSIPEGAPLGSTSSAPPQPGVGVTLGPITLNPTGRLHLDLRVPIGGAASLGTIVLRVNPHRHLFPMLERWPVPSRTAEAILVRREGNEVVFLHSRHRADIALGLRLPLDSNSVPSVRAARGEMGTQEGIDYRSEPVISSARAIPGSNGILVAKVDQAEVYAPIRAEAGRAVLVVVTLLLAVGLAAAYLLRERHTLALQRALSAERDRSALAERLALVTQHANDIILVLSEEGRILEANERAATAYGYTVAELLSMNTADFRADGDRAAAALRLGGLAHDEGVRFESKHRRKDGSTFDLEISGRAVMSEGRRVIMAIHRDVSEGKAHEVQIQRVSRLYAALSHVNQAIVRATTEQGLLDQVCQALVDAGRFRMAWVGEVDTSTNGVKVIAAHGDTSGYLAHVRITINDEPEGRGPTGSAIRHNRTEMCDDILTDPRFAPWRDAAFRAGYRSLIGLPLALTGGRRGVLTVHAEEPGFFKQEEIALLEEAAVDTAFGLANLDKDERRRQAEESLRKVSIAVEQSPVSIVITDLRGNIEYVNPHFCRLSGYSREEIIGQNPRLLQSGETPAAVYAEMWRRLTAGEEWEGEFHNRKKDGELFWEHATISPVRDASGEIKSYVGVKEDVTERRRAEEQMAAQLAELLRWQAAMLGREGRVQELKREVNELSHRLGHPAPYPSQDSAPPGHTKLGEPIRYPSQDKPPL